VKASPDDLMSPLDAARVLDMSADMVRWLSNQGRLPTLRTVTGRRLFRRGDVEHLATERREAKRRAARGRQRRAASIK
jgi:DNA-binding transcriptional MerR regulator